MSDDGGAARQSTRWVIALIALVVGMAIMWVMVKVDFSGSAEAQSPDDLARAAFKALRAGKFSSFEAHVADEQDLLTFINQVRSNGTDEDRERAESWLTADGGLAKRAAENMEESRRTFAKALVQARKKHLDWSLARYGGIDQRHTRLKEQAGVSNGHVRFNILVGDEVFRFGLVNCAQLEGVWVCAGGVRFPGYVAPDAPPIPTMREGEEPALRGSAPVPEVREPPRRK